MMSCRDFTEALYELVSQELPEDRRAAAADHLDRCPPCVVLLESYQFTITLARQLPPVPMPPDCARRLRAALDAGAGG